MQDELRQGSATCTGGAAGTYSICGAVQDVIHEHLQQ